MIAAQKRASEKENAARKENSKDAPFTLFRRRHET